MKTMEVIFKVTKLEDSRKSNSSLEIGKTYPGILNLNTNAIFWEDPSNGQSWVFWVSDTCEIVKG